MANPGPVYSVQVDVVGCRFELRANDVPLLRSERGRPINSEFPLNEWIRSGTNNITIAVRPPKERPDFDDSARASATVFSKIAGQPRKSRSEVKKIEGKLPKGQVHEHTVAVDFTAQVPFPASVWFSAPPIAAAESILTERIRALHKMLANRDITGFIASVEARERELAACYYQTFEERASNLRFTLEALTSPNKARLLDLPTELRVELFANGRLAEVVGGPTHESPIAFASIPDGFGARFVLRFCRIPDGRVLVIR